MHPDYFSTEFGEGIAKKENGYLVKIQHHEAHLATVIGENNFEKTKLSIISDINNHKASSEIELRFHLTLVDIIDLYIQERKH